MFGLPASCWTPWWPAGSPARRPGAVASGVPGRVL